MDALRERVRLIAGSTDLRLMLHMVEREQSGWWDAYGPASGWDAEQGCFMKDGQGIGTREEWLAAVETWRALGEPGPDALWLVEECEAQGGQRPRRVDDYLTTGEAWSLWGFLHPEEEQSPTVTAQDLAGWAPEVLDEARVVGDGKCYAPEEWMRVFAWPSGALDVLVCDEEPSDWSDANDHEEERWLTPPMRIGDLWDALAEYDAGPEDPAPEPDPDDSLPWGREYLDAYQRTCFLVAVEELEATPGELYRGPAPQGSPADDARALGLPWLTAVRS